ncbi:MAG: nitronate monooxygenase family protein [Proteobacteria bacterium]|nr:nitronate monooxygenase family protein [Pseudomonadota bacterium]
MKTKLTELLGIEHPVIQGGMQWVGKAELASAVSEAGGLGILTALTQPSPGDLVKEIRRMRAMTRKPFGVNLTLLPTLKPVPYGDYVDVMISEKIKIVETAGRSPEEFMPRLLEAGIKVIHKCTSVRHALKAQKIGCAAASVDGFECAGHPGEDDIPGLVLLPLAVDALSIPVIASGGFGDGRGLAAALCLGAEGINMGTRFLATREAPIHENVKKALVDADERQSALILRTLKNTARIYKNSVAKDILAMESRGNITIEELSPLVSGARGRTVYENGDIEAGVWSAGMVAGLIRDIPSVRDLITRIVKDAETIIKGRLHTMIS